jgi:hypothetical protein
MRLSTPSDYATPTLVRDVVEYFVHEKFAFENWCFIISLEQNWDIKGTIGLFWPYLITIKNKFAGTHETEPKCGRLLGMRRVPHRDPADKSISALYVIDTCCGLYSLDVSTGMCVDETDPE